LLKPNLLARRRYGKPMTVAEPKANHFATYTLSERHQDKDLVRLNKCVVSLSRRGADAAISEGKVTVNGRVASCGTKVKYGDVVRYDGKIQNWEVGASAREERPNADHETRKLTYVKYWKPVGVTCTADSTDRSNIISTGQFNLFPQRLFTVGRLDKDSSGLILLTSDGRVSNSMLNQKYRKEKVYLVEMNKRPSDDQLSQLRSGVVITTPLQREKSSRKNEVTAKTLSCQVRRAPNNEKVLEFTLIEGRNRQIRRMAEAVGLLVIKLHRTSFVGITLKGLKEGDWLELSPQEMMIIQKAMAT